MHWFGYINAAGNRVWRDCAAHLISAGTVQTFHIEREGAVRRRFQVKVAIYAYAGGGAGDGCREIKLIDMKVIDRNADGQDRVASLRGSRRPGFGKTRHADMCCGQCGDLQVAVEEA